MILAFSAAHQRFRLVELRQLEKVLPRLYTSLSECSEVNGFVILSTCHRIELYLDASSTDEAEAFVDGILIEAMGAQAASQVVRLSDVAAARHLFEVASGLKSLVVGENQISHQVKAAMGLAQEEQRMTPALYRLFRSATRVAKAVAGTDLGRQGRSLIGTALKGFTVERALVIGTGTFARVTLAQLRRQGCSHISVFSPSGRAAAFAATHGVAAIGKEDLLVELTMANLVLGCSGQQGHVLTPEIVQPALLRRGSPLRIIDLALRPDIDPEVGEFPGVTLYTLEDLTGDAEVDISAAECLVAEAVTDYCDSERERDAIEVLRQVRDHVQAIAAAEISQAERHLADLTERQADWVRLLVHRICQGVLHGPSVRARDLARQGRLDDYQHAVNVIFGLDQPGT